jgi:hypothetical protein
VVYKPGDDVMLIESDLNQSEYCLDCHEENQKLKQKGKNLKPVLIKRDTEWEKKKKELVDRLEMARVKMMEALKKVENNFHDPKVIQTCLEFDEIQNEYDRFMKEHQRE